MQATGMKYTGDDLLQTASGEALLVLMSMSNAAMRRQIRRQLDFRAATRNVRPAEIRPLSLRAMALGRAA